MNTQIINSFEEENQNKNSDFPFDELIPNSFFDSYCSNILANKWPEILKEENNNIFQSIPSDGNQNNFKDIKEPSSMVIKFPLPFKTKSISKEGNEEDISEKIPVIDIIPPENFAKNLKKERKNDNDNGYNRKIFNVFNLFNPRGVVNSEELNEKLKLVREEINQVINKKAKEKNNNYKFKIINKDNIKKETLARKRKEKPDDLRKKIKARFLKALRVAINEKLKKAKSEKEFDFLPQCFVCAITKQKNDISILNMTLKELMSTDFFTKYNLNLDKNKNLKEEKKTENFLKKKRNKTCPDINKYKRNVDVIKYLENNKQINEKANFEVISKMKFFEIFEEYLSSKEFEEDIYKLKKDDKEDQDYINDYIIKANEFINYFSQSRKISK